MVASLHKQTIADIRIALTDVFHLPPKSWRMRQLTTICSILVARKLQAIRDTGEDVTEGKLRDIVTRVAWSCQIISPQHTFDVWLSLRFPWLPKADDAAPVTSALLQLWSHA